MSSSYGSRVYAGRVYGGDYGVPGYGDRGYGEFPRDSWIEIPIGPKWSQLQTFSHYWKKSEKKSFPFSFLFYYV